MMIISLILVNQIFMKLGLLMGADSRKRREYLGEVLRISCAMESAFKAFGIVWNHIRGARRGYVKLLDYQ